MIKLIHFIIFDTLFNLSGFINRFFLFFSAGEVYHKLIVTKVEGILRLLQAIIIFIGILTVSFARNFGL